MSDAIVTLKHGAGGRAMRRLIEEVLAAGFAEFPVDGIGLEAMDDGAALCVGDRWLVITTDAHVVQPAFFPGGDIGRLAIAGTVNDLAMMGACEPLGLASAVILEEGFPRADLERIQRSMLETCREAGVAIVTGDTKVVEHGAADRLFINTAGIGWIKPGIHLSGMNARPGDRVLLSGYVGDHEIAVLSQREGFGFEGSLKSDCAPLNGLVQKMLDACPSVRCLRDPTRGGLATTLNEVASMSSVGITIEEEKVPVRDAVRGISELLGLDPLYLANEGKLIAICPAHEAEKVLEVMKSHPLGQDAEIIGSVTEENPKRVTLHTLIGGHRVLDMLTGAQYPRIC